MLCTFANLDEKSLDEVQSFEKKAGRTLLAYSCRDIPIASMSDEELAELRKLEDKLCVQLVAVH
jgi:hypothetical protein